MEKIYNFLRDNRIPFVYNIETRNYYISDDERIVNKTITVFNYGYDIEISNHGNNTCYVSLCEHTTKNPIFTWCDMPKDTCIAMIKNREKTKQIFEKHREIIKGANQKLENELKNI